MYSMSITIVSIVKIKTSNQLVNVYEAGSHKMLVKWPPDVRLFLLRQNQTFIVAGTSYVLLANLFQTGKTPRPEQCIWVV